MKYIGVGGIVLSICREFLSNRRQRVVVDGASSEWIPILSGVPQGSVLAPLLFILYTSEMFALVEDRLHICLCWWLRISSSCSQGSRQTCVAASLNKDLARIQEWFNHWWRILNPNKTKILVVSRSRTVNPSLGELVLSGVSICTSPSLDIFGAKFDRPCAWEDHVSGIVSCASQRVGILMLVKCILVDTPVLLRCYNAFVLPILECCSPMWGSAAECHLQLL